MKKPVREMTDLVREAVSEAIISALDETGYLETCLNCTHFTEETEQCSLVGSRPPARIIVFGCEKFQDEGTHAYAPVVRALTRPTFGLEDMDDDIPF